MHYSMISRVVGVCWLSVSLLAAVAAEFYVGPDGNDAWDGLTPASAKRTVPAAIAAAADGDTVLALDGVYELDATIEINKGVTVRSVNGREQAVLDGLATRRCVELDHPAARLEGFTVRNGLADAGNAQLLGGGILNVRGVVTECLIVDNRAETGAGIWNGVQGVLLNSEVSGNIAEDLAGGVWNEGVVSNCLIAANSAVEAGGLYVTGPGKVYTSLIEANAAAMAGGGIINDGGLVRYCAIVSNQISMLGNAAGVYNMAGGLLEYSSITSNGILSDEPVPLGMAFFAGGVFNNAGVVRGCHIADNAAIVAGGIYNFQGEIRDCLVEDNVAGIAGGIWNEDVALAVNCVVRYNQARPTVMLPPGRAGGVYNGEDAQLRNCLVVGNEAVFGAGAMNDGIIDNCTIIGNAAQWAVGGFDNWGEVRNSIIYFNDAPLYPDFMSDDTPTSINYSCLAEPFEGVGNITNQPGLIDPGSGYGLAHVYGDYRPAGGSSCVDAAWTAAWMLEPDSVDLDGNPRIIYEHPDMGAYEYFAAPSALTASAGTHAGWVALAWQAPEPLPESYQVWRGRTDDLLQAQWLANSEETAYDDASAVPGTVYYYWVRPVLAGPGPFSPSAAGWRAILPPAGLTAGDGVHTDAVRLAWDASVGALEYLVYRGTGSDFSQATLVGTTPGLSWADATALPGVLYYYRVAAQGLDRRSAIGQSVTGWRRSQASTQNNWGDVDGDGLLDLIVYNPRTGVWQILLSGSGYDAISLQLGGPGCVPAPADYDGDGRTDPAVYRESNGAWEVFLRHGEFWRLETRYFGGPGWQPVPGDYDGDGLADLTVYHRDDGLWRGLLSSTGYAATELQLGGAGRLPAPADYDGDGRTDPAVYDPHTGLWVVKLSGQGHAPVELALGGAGWLPVPADYDGDGLADPAVYHQATGEWRMLLSGSGYSPAGGMFGGADWLPAPADYDGDGLADPVVYNLLTGEWVARLSGSGYSLASMCFGGAPWQPVY